MQFELVRELVQHQVVAVLRIDDTSHHYTPDCMLQLARRCQELLALFTGGEEGVKQAISRMVADEEHVQQHTEPDRELMDYGGLAHHG